ncbi:MAG: DUF1559 domain-containing protein [Planctomycetota bacterium]|nr:DUF1559 domain-containing protein [Planctomycetota bacterium]MDA1250564.1 DUF1559 domain-containing protein [Planctomycetota bacterium]
MTHPRSQIRPGFTLVELVTVVFVVTILLVLLAPSIQKAQQDARLDTCKYHLKQIGLALHNYNDVHATMPPAWTGHHPGPGEGGRYGWSMFLTPYVDEGPIYNRVDFNDQKPGQAQETRTALTVFRCPSDTTAAQNSMRGGFGTSNYSGNFGMVAAPRWLASGLSTNWPGQAPTPIRTDGIFWLNSSCRFRDITDGSSNTFMVGERAVSSAAGIWMGVRGNNFESDQVTDCSPGNEINSGIGSFSSSHKGGAVFLMCDGSVRFIAENIESGMENSGRGSLQPKTFQRLASRHDNLVVGEF